MHLEVVGREIVHRVVLRVDHVDVGLHVVDFDAEDDGRRVSLWRGRRRGLLGPERAGGEGGGVSDG